MGWQEFFTFYWSFPIPRIYHNFFPVQVFAKRNAIGTVVDAGAKIRVVGAGEAMCVLTKYENTAAGFKAKLQEQVGRKMTIIACKTKRHFPAYGASVFQIKIFFAK